MYTDHQNINCPMPPDVPLPLAHLSPQPAENDRALNAIFGPPAARRGQIIEISGPPASGKTSLCLHLLGQVQRQGQACAWIDADQTFEPGYARRCGLDLESLLVARPRLLEEALDMLEKLVQSGALQTIVVDGLQSLPAQAQLNASLGASGEEQALADNDRLLSQTLRSLAGALHAYQTTLVFTSREQKTNVSSSYHDLAKNTARLALKLRAGLRLRLIPGEALPREGQALGQRIRVGCIKNQITPCRQSMELDIMWNGTIKNFGEQSSPRKEDLA